MSLGSTKHVCGELCAHAAGDEDKTPVRREPADPVEGAAVDQRNVLTGRAPHIDHESESVVVPVLELVALDRNAIHGRSQTISQCGAVGGGQNPHAPLREGITMLFEPIEGA